MRSIVCAAVLGASRLFVPVAPVSAPTSAVLAAPAPASIPLAQPLLLPETRRASSWSYSLAAFPLGVGAALAARAYRTGEVSMFGGSKKSTPKKVAPKKRVAPVKKAAPVKKVAPRAAVKKTVVKKVAPRAPVKKQGQGGGGLTAFLMSGMNGLELLSGATRKEDVSKRFDITYDTRGLKQGNKLKKGNEPWRVKFSADSFYKK